MLRNYLRIALRNLRNHLSYSSINIFGLAIGIACSLVIFLYVYGEWSYDHSFKNADRIYRIGISFFNIGKFANGPERLLEVLPKDFAGIETATRIQKDRDLIVAVKGQVYKEPEAYYTDSAFFHVFDYSFVAGNEQRILSEPNEIVLTETMARKYFKRTDVLGETLEIGKEKTAYKITGVIKDPHFNSHLRAPIWLSIQTQLKGEPAWSSAAFHNYVLLRKNSTQADLLTALDRVLEKYVFPESGKPMGFTSLADYKKSENSVKFYVHPLKDIYLKSKLNLEISPGGNESSIFIFSAISLFILTLAAVNFVNLTTARASKRAKEVGIRKTMGTSRRKLIAQFLIESVMTTLVAMLFALLFSELFLRAFEYITGVPLLSTIWRNPSTVLLFVGFSLIVGILSGLYPAFYLTSFLPVKVLKGNLVAAGGRGFRNFLVVFQFSVSMVLIVCSLVVHRQMLFLQNKDLGFDQENVVTVDNGDLLKSSADAFKDELSRESSVITASLHMGEPGSKRILSFYTYQTAAMQNSMTINTYFGDADYMKLMGFRLVAGRGFSKELASDSASVVFNEAAVKALNLGDNPLGADVNKGQKVIGIVSDFHWESLRSSIAPLAILLSKEPAQIGFKLQGNAIPAFLKTAETKWKQLVPDEPFRYHFLDENFAELLQKEKVFARAISLFTVLAIFISCLGLYGLSAYTAEQRTKEIGIRKVLGASASTIVIMLNKNFTRLVLISVLISVPASLYLANRWLEGFAYKMEMEAWVFLAAVAGSLLIAWFTVSYHSLRAAWINPSDTLKYE